MKILRTVVSAIVAAAGVWLCVAQDTTLDRLDFYIYSVCSSLLITLAVAFGIFTFIKHSFGRFIGVTVAVNAAICIFHAYKYNECRRFCVAYGMVRFGSAVQPSCCRRGECGVHTGIQVHQH